MLTLYGKFTSPFSPGITFAQDSASWLSLSVLKWQCPLEAWLDSDPEPVVERDWGCCPGKLLERESEGLERESEGLERGSECLESMSECLERISECLERLSEGPEKRSSGSDPSGTTKLPMSFVYSDPKEEKVTGVAGKT